MLRPFEDQLGDAFGKGMLVGVCFAMPLGAALMFVALLVGGALR